MDSRQAKRKLEEEEELNFIFSGTPLQAIDRAYSTLKRRRTDSDSDSGSGSGSDLTKALEEVQRDLDQMIEVLNCMTSETEKNKLIE